MGKNYKIILYILAWISSWLIFCSIINAGLIATNVYSSVEKGRLITFFIGAMISIGGAISITAEWLLSPGL